MELDFVAALLARIPADPRLEVPPGDDAAVLRPPAERRTVVTTDMLVEGRHFRRDWSEPADIGHKMIQNFKTTEISRARTPRAQTHIAEINVGRDRPHTYDGSRERSFAPTNRVHCHHALFRPVVNSQTPGRAWRGCRDQIQIPPP